MENKNNKCYICGKLTKRRKLCPGHYTKIRRYRQKLRAIELLGGKCNRCGWVGNIAGFEFHHLRDKESEIGNVANKSWSLIKKELEKCELLCSICHRIEHSNNEDTKFLEAVLLYKGLDLD